jgi:glycosyltransferase involved in cell wall biosynthesis
LGARAGSGKWIAFLDHDDQWLDGKLEKQLALALSTHADVVYTNSANIGDIDRVKAAAYQSSVLPCGDVFEQLLADNFLIASSVLVRREAFDNVGGFSEDGEVTEDWDLWLRLAAAGYSFQGTPEILTQYLWRRSSVSKSHSAARKLRNATVGRALLSARAKSLSWAQVRRIRANAEATSAWFLAAEHPAHAILWYVNALRYWPFDIRSMKGLVKGVFRLS